MEKNSDLLGSALIKWKNRLLDHRTNGDVIVDYVVVNAERLSEPVELVANVSWD